MSKKTQKDKQKNEPILPNAPMTTQINEKSQQKQNAKNKKDK